MYVDHVYFRTSLDGKKVISMFFVILDIQKFLFDLEKKIKLDL